METKKKAIGSSKKIKVGPWGGLGGSMWDDGSYNGVRAITLLHGLCVDSIQVEYEKYGKTVVAEKHGGSGGSNISHIKLQFPDEFLTTVSGYYCPLVQGGSPVIRSLTFKSNKGTFGPFGDEVGTPFIFTMEGGMIAGFSGRSGRYLDAIGFHLSRVHTSKLYDSMHLKLQKLGNMASKQLGQKPREHGSTANAKASRVPA